MRTLNRFTEEPEGGFGNALARGVDQTQLMAFGAANALGEATGIDFLARWGEEGIVRNMEEIAANPAQVESWDDVNSLADFYTYFTERLGEQIPNLASLVGTGGLAGIAGKAAAGKALKNKVGDEAFDAFLSRRKQLAQAAGATVAGTALNAGETQIQFRQEGIDAPGAALFTGAVKGALDALAPARLLGLSQKTGVGADDLPGALGGALKELVATGAIESVTEGAQALVDRVALNVESGGEIDVFSPEGIKDIRESLIVGGLVGGSLGGGVSLIDAYRSRRQSAFLDNEAAETPDSPTPEPESQGTIDAQARALVDDSSSKDTLLITPGSPLPSPGILPEGLDPVQTPRGQVISTNPEVVANPPQTEAEEGAVLFGPQARPRDQSDGTVVQALDAEGIPVAEIATSRQEPDRLNADLLQAENLAPAGGRVHISTAEEAVALRGQALDDEFTNAFNDPAPNAVKEAVNSLPLEARARVTSVLNGNPSAEDANVSVADVREILAPTLAKLRESGVRKNVEEQSTEDLVHGDFNVTESPPGELFIESRGAAPSAPESEFVVKAGLQIAKEGKKRRGLARSKPVAKDSFIEAVDPGGQQIDLSTRAITSAGRDLLRARGLAEEVKGDEFLLRAFTEMLGELTNKGYDVSNAFVNGSDRLNPRLLIDHGNLSRGQGLKRAGAVSRKAASRNHAAAGFAEVRDGNREVLEGRTDDELRAFSTNPNTHPDTAALAEEVLTRRSREGEDITTTDARLDRREEVARAEQRADEAINREEQARPANRLVPSAQPVNASGRAVGYGDVTQVEAQFVSDTLQELGFAANLKVNVLSSDLLAGNKLLKVVATDLLTGQQAARAAQLFAANSNLKGLYVGRGKSATVVLRPFSSKQPTAEQQANRIMVLGHELGHGVLDATLSNTTEAQRRALDKAFEADRAEYLSRFKTNEAKAKKEWFADKVAARAKRTSTPKKNGVVERLTDNVLKQWRSIWNNIKKRMPPRFRENYDFNAAIEQMKAEGAFDAATTFGESGTLERFDEFEKNILQLAIPKPTAAQARQFAVKASKGTYNMAVRLFGTVHGALQNISPGLANIVYTPVSETSAIESFTSGNARNKQAWARRLSALLKEHTKDFAPTGGRSEASLMEQALSQLAAEKPTSELTPLAADIRQLLNDFHSEYLKPRIPTLGQIENYFPRQYDGTALALRRGGAEAIFIANGMDADSAADTVSALLGESDTPYAIADGIVPKRISFMRQRKLDDPNVISALVDAGFLNPDPMLTLKTYFDTAISRGEFERLFGGYTAVTRDEAKEMAKELGLKGFKQARDWGYLQVEGGQFYFYNREALLEGYLSSIPAGPKRDEARFLVRQAVAPTATYTFSKAWRSWGLAQDPTEPSHTLRGKATRFFARMVAAEDLNVIRLHSELQLALKQRTPVAGLLKKRGSLSPEQREELRAWRAANEVARLEAAREHENMLRTAARGAGDPAAQANLDTHLNQPLPGNSLTNNTVRRARIYEAFRLLAFSGIASIPEVGGAVLRARGDKSSVKALKQVLNFKNWGEFREFAEQLGVIQNDAGAALASEMFSPTGQEMTKPEKYLRDLFKYNGNDAVMNAARVVSAVIGKQFLLSTAAKTDARSARHLRELGVEAGQVKRWEALGAPASSAGLSGQAREDTDAVAEALGKFIGDSTLVPESAEVPAISSHPLGALVVHLKTFMYNTNKKFVLGSAAEVKHVFLENGRGMDGMSAASAAAVAMYWPFFLVAVSLGAVSEELRRMLQKGGTTDADWVVDNPDKYLGKAIKRSGLGEVPYVDFFTDPSWSNLTFAAGPTIDHAAEFMQALLTEPETDRPDDLRALVRSVPGLSAFPEVRAMIYDTFEEDEADAIIQRDTRKQQQ